MQNNKFVIIGCGGHAKSVLDVLLFNEPDANVVFVDKNAKKDETILGYPVLDDYKIVDEKVFVAIGDNLKRAEEAKKYKNLVSIISKNAYIGKNVKVGKGVFVSHNVHIGIFSQIGDYSLINTGSSIDHECLIGEASFLAPKTNLCGKVKIGKNVFIGVGTSIIDGINICDDTIVGAGSVVIKSIDDGGTYVGIPAKRMI